MKMKLKLGIILITLALLAVPSLGLSSNAAASSVIYVPDDYDTIQAAVNAASPGDTIIVRDGTYTENVDVKKRLTIRSENGSEKTIVQAKDSSDGVFEVTDDYVNISGFTVERASSSYYRAGIYLKGVSRCNISNNNVLNNYNGISLVYSLKNSISGNNIAYNHYGIPLDNSSRNSISGNNIANSRGGILLSSSSENCISGNNITTSIHGIFLGGSSRNSISGNNITNNGWGIFLSSSSENSIRGNNITANYKDGLSLSSSSNNNSISGNNITANNYDGISLYYRSSNNSISGNNITASKWRDGISLYSSNNNSIRGNNIAHNVDGIDLRSSRNNSIRRNNITANNDDGIDLSYFSNDNHIYQNNFISNFNNAYSYVSINIWNSPKKITYTCKGGNYTTYLGNYWDDYTGVDADNDGIGDTPYSIDSDKDTYPLMVPFENYFAPPLPNIFDTEASSNPYPSISGTHYGTMKLNQTITVSKLYTYPCSGTGGHSEYVKIWNFTWSIEALWGGYKSDWHNISFPESFVLELGETYNYTIKTGSYPQIIHNSEFNAVGGKITCSNFTDVNGKSYNDWIPAITLY